MRWRGRDDPPWRSDPGAGGDGYDALRRGSPTTDPISTFRATADQVVWPVVIALDEAHRELDEDADVVEDGAIAAAPSVAWAVLEDDVVAELAGARDPVADERLLRSACGAVTAFLSAEATRLEDRAAETSPVRSGQDGSVDRAAQLTQRAVLRVRARLAPPSPPPPPPPLPAAAGEPEPPPSPGWLRGVMRGVGAPRAGSVATVVVSLALVALLIRFPGNVVLAVGVFGLLPVALVLGWVAQGHRTAELRRDGAQLARRLDQLRGLHRRLRESAADIEVVDIACRPFGPSVLRTRVDALDDAVRTASRAIAALADGLEDAAAVASTGSHEPAGDPADVVARGAPTLRSLASDAVREQVDEAHRTLLRLAPVVSATVLEATGSEADRWAGGLFPSGFAGEFDAVVDEFTGARRPLVAECRRLSRSIHAVHGQAARSATRRLTHRDPARALALTVVSVAGLPIVSRSERARRRTAYVDELAELRHPTLVAAGRAAAVLYRDAVARPTGDAA